ncbi:hypothetical protein Ancab_023094 [Ancistrocladus abbreviatus]
MAFESAVVSFVIQKLGEALIEEAKFLSGVEDQVKSLQRELTWMQSYLKDVEAEQEEGNERLRTRITEIRRIAYDAEDVIDSFILEAPARKRESLLKRYACCLTCLVHTHQIGAQIEAIKARIRESTEMLQTYGVGVRTGQGHRRRPRSYPHSNDDHVVGLDEDIKRLVELLTDVKNEANVLCFVGMGGSGKTTMARRLHNHEKIKQHFHCQAWVSISQEWNAQYVLSEILRQVTGEKRRSDESVEELVEKLRNFLEQKLYLIVLDDVWKKEALEDILPAFPFGTEGSKIIVTTRNHEIIKFPDFRCFVHQPRRLDEDEAWELFSRIALNHRHNTYNSHDFGNFEKLGEEMLRKCDGLPLAIVALGGLLSAKDTIEEWEKVSKVVSTRVMESRATSEYGNVRDMLALSYRELPYDLKPCFLYLALFPEDCEIPAGMLMRMWASEGFVSSQQLSQGETLEDAARQHLDELIQRCIVQVATRNYAGKVKTVRIHDLMRDLCIKKAKEQDFLQIYSSGTSTPANGSALDDNGSMAQSRRSVVHSYATMSIPPQTGNSHLRSLMVFGQANLGIHKYYTGESRVRLTLEPVYQNYQLLRVLNLVAVDTSDGILPASIGNLIFLRYLRIRCTNIIELPESIGNLRNLLTLDYRGVEDFHSEITVPNVLWKIKRLQHLFLPYDRTTMKGLELHTLNNLQTLWGVGGGNWMLKEMFTLSPRVERLRIEGISSKEQLEAVSKCPSLLSDHLHSLFLDWGTDGVVELLNLDMISHCNRLRKLGLRGVLRDKSLAFQFPSNLQKIQLLFTKLESQDTMAALGRLPSLKYLRLSRDSYMGGEWTCSVGEFPQLEQLSFLDLPNLEEWRVERGAMPCLKKLSIWQCSMLKRLPEGLIFIATLQELEIKFMSDPFYSRLRQADNSEAVTVQGGEDLHIIQRIPIVRID